MGEKMKLIPTVFYALVGVFGALAIWSLLTTMSFSLTVANLSAWFLAIGGFAWGLIKFMNFDLVKKAGVV